MKKKKNIHVYPVNDILEHNTKGTACICHPKINGNVVIHNSFDGREYREKGSKKLMN